MCIKLHDTALESSGIDCQLLAFPDGATFFGRATSDNGPALEEDVFREDCRLLHALTYEFSAHTVAE